MENPWNKFTIEISEIFKGPRTKDYEYDKMVQEYQLCKDRLLNLKSIIGNYPKKLEGYKTCIEELIKSFETIFEKDQGMYSKFMLDTTNAHKTLYDKLTNMFSRIEQLKGTIDKWVEYCSKVDEKLKFREEQRKDFDHYDEKMGDLYEERQKIIAKGNIPDEKNEEKYMRNIKKYKDAAKGYTDATNEAYKFICYFIDSKYENVSIGVAEFLEIELNFYSEVALTFNYFRNIRRNVLAIKKSFHPPIRNYDASNFIRGKALLNLNIEEIMKNGTKFSGVIEPNPNYTKENSINNNEQNKTNFNSYSKQPSFMGNFNTNAQNNPPLILNPYNSYNNKVQSSSSYNYNNSNIPDSISDPFGNNKKDEGSDNPFVPKIDQSQEKRNPYNQGSSFSGDNPFDKPNI